VDLRALDQDVADATLLDLIEELRERDFLRLRPLAGILEQREQCQQQEDDYDPKGKIAQIRIHSTCSLCPACPPALPRWAGKSMMVTGHGRFTSIPDLNLGLTQANAKGTNPRTGCICPILPMFRLLAAAILMRG